MNETFLESMQRKGWVQAADGSWSKPKNLGMGGSQYGNARTTESVLDSNSKTVSSPAHPAKRIRQSRDKMNKLELEWFGICKAHYPEDCRILAQAIRFRLGNGIWYKPDVLVFGAAIYAYEVKGPHAFRGGFENLKVAASQYPWIKWTLVWKENGQWQEQEVLP